MKRTGLKWNARRAAWILILLLGIASGTHLLRTALRANETRAILIAVLCFAFCLVFGLGWRKTSSVDPVKRGPYLPWSSLPIILLAIWAANARLFGKFDVSAVLFHAKHSLNYDGVGDDIIEFAGFLLFALICLACLAYLARRDQRAVWVDRIGALLILLINPVTTYAYDSWFNPDRGQLNLAELYHPASFGARETLPKNLILIYLESMEATFAEAPFGDVFQDLNALSYEGLRINGVSQIEDTGWTMGGLTASQCGIPLLSYGLIMKNRMKNIKTFLPEADCLASHLSDRGYLTRYYGGAPLAFAGKDQFLTTHGYQKTVGLNEIPEAARGPVGEWGIYDDRLFELALTELETLSKRDAPYLLTVLTLGAHFPSGYPAPICQSLIEGAAEMDTTLLSVACTARLTRDFLDTARAQGLLENTTVILLSDHLAQKNTVAAQLDQFIRENFVLILGDDIEPGAITKTGSMIDLYPTILDAMGLPASDNTAGLGVSLLGTQPTLLETHGAEALNLAIRSDNALREQLWGLNELKAP